MSGSGLAAATRDDDSKGLDDGVQSIALPFPITLYNRIFTSAAIGANGNIQFASNNQLAVNGALPRLGFGPAIFAYWDDLRTDGTDAAGQPFGIFTQVTGDTPNRIFHVRWHAQYFAGGGGVLLPSRGRS